MLHMKLGGPCTRFLCNFSFDSVMYDDLHLSHPNRFEFTSCSNAWSSREDLLRNVLSQLSKVQRNSSIGTDECFALLCLFKRWADTNRSPHVWQMYDFTPIEHINGKECLEIHYNDYFNEFG